MLCQPALELLHHFSSSGCCCSLLTASQLDTAAEMIRGWFLPFRDQWFETKTYSVVIWRFHIWEGRWNQNEDFGGMWKTGQFSWHSCCLAASINTSWVWREAAPPGLVVASVSLGLAQAFKAVRLLHIGQPGGSHYLKGLISSALSMLSQCSLRDLWVFSEGSLEVPWVISERSLGALWVICECSLNTFWELSKCTLSDL